MTLFSKQTASQSWFSKMKGPSLFGKNTVPTAQTRPAGNFIASSDRQKVNPLEKASHHKK
jgi:hypothetical protein